MPFFGDQRKAEYQKEIEKINAAIASESSEEKKAALQAEKDELIKELENID